MTGVKNHRPSPLQRNMLVLLAGLAHQGTHRVRTRDLELLLEQGGDRPVYGNNLRASCRRMEDAGWLRTLRAPNLQLAVELTDAGMALAAPLLINEKERTEARQRAAEIRVLPLVRVKPVYPSDTLEEEYLVELAGCWQRVCRADYVVRLAGSTCLQLWRADGQVSRLEGDPLQVAQWFQICHDAGINVRVQINESQTPEEGTGNLKNAEFPGGQAAHTLGIWYDGLSATLRRHHISLSGNRHRRAIVSPGSRQREMSVQERFLSLVTSLQGTRDALTCSRVENESAAALRAALTRFGFSPEQQTTLLTMIAWPIEETEEQQRLALATLLAELAARGIDGDREKLMTLVFSPVRRPEETWRGRLQWLLGSELAKGFRFGSPLTQQEAEPVLAWFEQTLGHPAMQVFCQAISWGIDGGEDNSGMVYQNKEHE